MSQTLESPAAIEAANALELRDLDVVYRVRGRDRQVLRGVTLAQLVRRPESEPTLVGIDLSRCRPSVS